jgi:hypothetical protein
MTLHVTQLEAKTEHKSFRLTRPGGSPTAREVRDDVIVPADRARAILAAATQRDVANGGVYSPGPAGVQLWSGAWNGPTGGPGTAEHLGSVDWSWDAPTTGLVTVYRVMRTDAGVTRGLTTDQILDCVLALAGGEAVHRTSAPSAASLPLPRDPFRAESWAPPALTQH